MPAAHPMPSRMIAAGPAPSLPAGAAVETNGREGAGHPAGYSALVIGALGVVYGAIGTSPRYAVRETFAGWAIEPLPTTYSVGGKHSVTELLIRG